MGSADGATLDSGTGISKLFTKEVMGVALGVAFGAVAVGFAAPALTLTPVII